MKKVFVFLFSMMLLLSCFGCKSDQEKALEYFEKGDYYNAYVLYNKLEDQKKSDEVVLKWVKELVKPENVAGDENFKDINIYSKETYDKVFQTVLEISYFSRFSPYVEQLTKILNGFSKGVLKEEEIKIKEALNAEKGQDCILLTATEEERLNRGATDDYFLEDHIYTYNNRDPYNWDNYEPLLNKDKTGIGWVAKEKYGFMLHAYSNFDGEEEFTQYAYYGDTSKSYLLNQGNLGDKFGFLVLTDKTIYQVLDGYGITFVYQFDQKPENFENMYGHIAANFVLYTYTIENGNYILYRINMLSNNAVRYDTNISTSAIDYIALHRPLNSNVIVFSCINPEYIEKVNYLANNKEKAYALFKKHGYEINDEVKNNINDFLDEECDSYYYYDYIEVIEKEYGTKYNRKYTYLIRENKLSYQDVAFERPDIGNPK